MLIIESMQLPQQDKHGHWAARLALHRKTRLGNSKVENEIEKEPSVVTTLPLAFVLFPEGEDLQQPLVQGYSTSLSSGPKRKITGGSWATQSKTT